MTVGEMHVTSIVDVDAEGRVVPEGSPGVGARWVCQCEATKTFWIGGEYGWGSATRKLGTIEAARAYARASAAFHRLNAAL